MLLDLSKILWGLILGVSCCPHIIQYANHTRLPSSSAPLFIGYGYTRYEHIQGHGGGPSGEFHICEAPFVAPSSETSRNCTSNMVQSCGLRRMNSRTSHQRPRSQSTRRIRSFQRIPCIFLHSTMAPQAFLLLTMPTTAGIAGFWPTLSQTKDCVHSKP